MAAAEKLFTQWTRLYAEVLTAMAGQTAVVTPVTPGAAVVEPISWWGQTFSLEPDELIWIGSSADDSSEIGKIALAGAGLDDPTPEDIEGTFRELLGQALSGLGQEIGKLLKKEVSCARGGPTNSPVEGLPFLFHVGIAGKTLGPITIQFSEKLISLIDSIRTASPAAAIAPQLVRSGDARNSIELLLDVELPVRVSFGKAVLPLKDVLKLTTGSIVELNRSVNEPVDILVNNCVIARGEVVVVDGNYGVRLNQIVSRQDRIKTVS